MEVYVTLSSLQLGKGPSLAASCPIGRKRPTTRLLAPTMVSLKCRLRAASTRVFLLSMSLIAVLVVRRVVWSGKLSHTEVRRHRVIATIVESVLHLIIVQDET